MDLISAKSLACLAGLGTRSFPKLIHDQTRLGFDDPRDEFEQYSIKGKTRVVIPACQTFAVPGLIHGIVVGAGLDLYLVEWSLELHTYVMHSWRPRSSYASCRMKEDILPFRSPLAWLFGARVRSNFYQGGMQQHALRRFLEIILSSREVSTW